MNNKIQEDTPEWYEKFIEKSIQPLVKLLRNNGFNTMSSCGHEMICHCIYSMEGEIKRVYELLLKNEYNHFIIEVIILGPKFIDASEKKSIIQIRVFKEETK